MKKKYSYIILLIASISVLLLFYGKIAFDPNNYVFIDGGDGIKNYYTPYYYVKYEKGSHFSGMNYPYGENIIYTDNQPVISYTLSLLKNVIPGIENYTLGILNMLMMLSFLIAVFFIYKILKRLQLPGWYAIVAALLIGFLSPQLERTKGHYALVYGCYIPILWYLFISYFYDNHKIRSTTWIIITIILFSFIHPYYSLMGILFFIVFAIIHILFNTRGLVNILRKLLTGITIAVIPLLFFAVWLKLNDPVTDRPVNPWGIYQYRTIFEGVFLPGGSPFLDVWNFFIKVRGVDGEGKAYVGFASALVLVFTIIRFIKYAVHKRWIRIIKLNLPAFLTVSVWAGVIILLFSMAVPFIWGMDFLLDIFTPLKQFRSLGRFAWVFYYIFTVYAVYYLFLLYRKLNIQKLPVVGATLLSFMAFSWMLDVYVHNRSIAQWITNKHPDLFSKEYKTKLYDSGYRPEDFQALLPLPFFLIGSEKIGSARDHYMMVESFKASGSTGLPIIGGSSSRTSLRQAINLAGIISDTLITKKVLNDFKNDKPLLLMVNKQSTFFPSESYLIARAKYIMDYKEITYYMLPLSALKSNAHHIIEKFPRIKNKMEKSGDMLMEKSSQQVVMKHLENTKSKESFYNNSSMYVKKGKYELFKGTLTSGEYEASLWVKIVPETLLPVFFHKKTDSTGNMVYTDINFRAGDSYDIVKDWVRVSYFFTVTANEQIHMWMDGDNYYLSEWMIRPRNTNVYSNVKNDSTFFYNNIPVNN